MNNEKHFNIFHSLIQKVHFLKLSLARLTFHSLVQLSLSHTILFLSLFAFYYFIHICHVIATEMELRFIFSFSTSELTRYK